ncbi:MAG: CHASE2 domain-containing protein [Archangium sp.]|nr:CHASE2 domain-containing protein [Archangium sp.]
MATNPLQSAGRRFLQKFGVAFVWALLVGGAIGGTAASRLERRDLTVDPPWHVVGRLWLERLEWVTLDWRVRELGGTSQRSDDVVLVTVDEETEANVHESEHIEWAMRPWARELSGALVGQLVKEGASSVLIDQPLAEPSPHSCAPCRGDANTTDDERFAAQIAKLTGKVTVGVDVSTRPARQGERPLAPVLVRIGAALDEPNAPSIAREVLRRRTATYVIPADGAFEVWAGVASEAKAKSLLASIDPAAALVVRRLVPADDAFEVDASWLALRQARVEVPGLDPERLLRARQLDAPVAAALPSSAALGVATLKPDPDGRLRAMPLFTAMQDAEGRLTTVASAALVAVLQHLKTKELRYEDGRLHLGPTLSVPMTPDGFLQLRFDTEAVARAERGTVKRALPAFRLLQNRDDDDVARGIRHHDNELEGKLVVFADGRSGPAALLTPVGEIGRPALLAQAMVNLLRGEGITRAPPQHDAWLTVAFAFVGALLAVAWSSLVRRPGWLAWVATLVVVGILHALVARQIFVQQLRWVAVASPLLACGVTFLAALGYARALEQGLRDFMVRALGGAVRDDVVRRVERDLALMHPERRPLTIYFSDIEGFTAAAHELAPETVVRVLRSYLNEMTSVVLDARGHVDKYLGDGLMAFWGAPVTLDDQVATACRTALELQRRFDAKRAEWEKDCGRPLVLRAGLDTGPTVVGEMGTLHRVNYTVMGEPVAMSFRLEALAKKYHARIVVGPSVPELAGAAFAFRELDTLRLGRGQGPVRLYELLGTVEELGPAAIDRLHAWELAMRAWHDGRFTDAKALFEKMPADDELARRYVERCAWVLRGPPPTGWDGVFHGDATQ